MSSSRLPFNSIAPRLGRSLLLASAIWALLSSTTPGQSQPAKDAQKGQDEPVTLKTHLVTLDVLVKDKGKFITDLKAKDFAVSENGVPQVVEFFDPPIAGVDETARPKTADSKQPVKSAAKSANIISLVLDGATTDLANFKQVREGTLKYINERITDADAVAVFGVSTSLRLLQTFTRDKAKLISAVENAYLLTASNKNLEQTQLAQDIEQARAEAGASTSISASPGASAQGSSAAAALIAARALERFILLRSQLSAQQARPVLAALAALCQAQQSIPGKKTLVMFSQGFVAPSILDWQVQSVIDIANRANVAIYIIDSAGLRTPGPLSTSAVPEAPLTGVAPSLSTESRIRAVGGEDVFDNVRQEGLNREHDILYRISGDTGGEFIKGTNDFSKGLNRIDEEIRARYTLAYYSTDPNFDGSFRKIKVEVRRPGADVISRSGYYANPSEDIVPLSPEDKKLLANLPAIEGNPAMPVFMEISPFRFRDGRYLVPLSVGVPPTGVQFERKGDRRRVQFEVLGVIREGKDKVIARLGGNFDIALTADQYQAIVSNNIFYRQDMELVPGTYSIELLFRDKLSGKMTGKRETLVLPEASPEFSTSAVVLSRLALPVKNSPAGAESADVLCEGGAQIRPFPSRQFSAKDNLIIFFKLYNAAQNGPVAKPLVRVTVTLLKDGKTAVKPVDYMLMDTVGDPVPHLTFAKFISLAGLTPGKYDATIEARDMVAHKVITQHESFAITQ